MKKRIDDKTAGLRRGALSIMMAGVLAVGLCPASALAAEETGLAAGSTTLAAQDAIDITENVSIDDDWVYYSSATSYKPSISVKYFDDDYNSTNLTEGKDYTVSYSYVDDDYNETAVSGVTKAGDYRITITGIGAYTGSDSTYITVYDANDIAAAVRTDDTSWCFSSASAYKPSMGLAMRAADNKYGATLKEGTDYTVNYYYIDRDNSEVTPVDGLSKVGEYAAYFSGKGSYKGTRIETLWVGDLKVAGNTAQKCTGKAITPTLKLTWTDGENPKELDEYDYSVTYKNNVNPGTATITITGKGFYAGTASATFQITGTVPAAKPAAVSIAGAAVSGLSAKTYTGKQLKPAPTVKVSGKTLKVGTDYTVAYKNNVKAGTATVTITGKGGYTGTKTATFKINKAANTVKATGKTATVKYKDVKKKAQKLAVKKVVTVSKAKGAVTYKKASGNKNITVDKSGKVTVKKGLKKGTYSVKVKVTAAGNANYAKATKTVTFKVKVK